jgi:uncharacterized protein (TIGR03663 family)
VLSLKTLLFLLASITIVAVSVELRFFQLEAVPFHADEATGARRVGDFFESGSVHFEPKHFHGPTLILFGALSASAMGESNWKDLSAFPLRCVPALSGVLLVLLGIASAGLFGKGSSLWIAAFLAVSPPLVYTNRIFIHESLLVLFSATAILALGYWCKRPTLLRAVWIGGLLGLAGATKETFLLAPACVLLAALALRESPRCPWELTAKSAAVAASVALGSLFLFYSDFFSNPAGLVNFVSTYWLYELVGGHEKSFIYYLALMVTPTRLGGEYWWFGGVFLLSLVNLVLPSNSISSRSARFLTLGAFFQIALLSFIPYKVPWLVLLPWTLLTASAALAVSVLLMSFPQARVFVMVVAGGLLVGDFIQSRRLISRTGPDRNPLAYVSTVGGVADWPLRYLNWLGESNLADQHVAVVGSPYWPLPWHLRPYPKVGYYADLPPGIEDLPIVLVLPNRAEEATGRLAATHQFTYEGLRSDTIVTVCIRNDIWERALSRNRR